MLCPVPFSLYSIANSEGAPADAANQRDFQRLAKLRAAEAGALVRSRKEIGAYYLAGYAVECALKACVAKATKRHEFPPVLPQLEMERAFVR
jgi:hypothetical protein